MRNLHTFQCRQQRPAETSRDNSSAEHTGVLPTDQKNEYAGMYNPTAEDEGDVAAGDMWGAGGALSKKKRTRNNQQMELNRVAQQRYRYA